MAYFGLNSRGEEMWTATTLGNIKGRKKTVIYRSCCSSEVHRFPLTSPSMSASMRPPARNVAAFNFPANGEAAGTLPRRPMRHDRLRGCGVWGRTGTHVCLAWLLCGCAWSLPCLLHAPWQPGWANQECTVKIL